MSFSKKSGFLALFILTLMVPQLRAGFIIDVGAGINTSYNVNDTIRVPFIISTTNGDTIAAYSLAVDLGPVGPTAFGGTGAFDQIHADFSTKQFGDFAGSDDGTQGFFNIDLAPGLESAGAPYQGNVNFDYVVSNGQSTNANGPTLRMFELVITARQAGNYQVNAVIRTDPGNVGIGDNSAFTFIGLGPTNYDLNTTSITANNFSFSITAVPEPSSITMFLAASTLLCVRRRKRQNRICD